MVDITDQATRSRMMSNIPSKNTKPEIAVRRNLHRLGLRYRLHVRDLAGTPDLVFPQYKAVVFVNGCFWHQHSCPMFKMPSTRVAFWKQKLDRNQARDKENVQKLVNSGWRVATVWECSLRYALKWDHLHFFEEIVQWIKHAETDIVEF
jgi:DNA mismatch endonuclease (patch repair protein)